MASLAVIRVFYVFIIFHLQSTKGKQILCNSLSCGDIDIEFPFGLKGSNHDRRCSYYPNPSFQLSCDNQTRTILKLPNSGNIVVKSIDYETQTIKVNDPEGCLAKRFLYDWNLSGSPFKLSPKIYDTYYNLTFLRCPFNVTRSSSQLPLTPIHCLSDEANSNSNSSSVILVSWVVPIVSPCEVISTALVPLPGMDMPMWPFWPDLNNDVGLVWTEPRCGNCAFNGQVCGFSKDKSLQVGCFPSPSSKEHTSFDTQMDDFQAKINSYNVQAILERNKESHAQISSCLKRIEDLCVTLCLHYNIPLSSFHGVTDSLTDIPVSEPSKVVSPLAPVEFISSTKLIEGPTMCEKTLMVATTNPTGDFNSGIASLPDASTTKLINTLELLRGSNPVVESHVNLDRTHRSEANSGNHLSNKPQIHTSCLTQAVLDPLSAYCREIICFQRPSNLVPLVFNLGDFTSITANLIRLFIMWLSAVVASPPPKPPELTYYAVEIPPPPPEPPDRSGYEVASAVWMPI